MAAADAAVIAVLCHELRSVLQPLQRIVFVPLRIVKAAVFFFFPPRFRIRETPVGRRVWGQGEGLSLLHLQILDQFWTFFFF